MCVCLKPTWCAGDAAVEELQRAVTADRALLAEENSRGDREGLSCIHRYIEDSYGPPCRLNPNPRVVLTPYRGCVGYLVALAEMTKVLGGT